MKFSIFYFCLFVISLSVHAENHLLLMGGGGDPAGNTTIFDSSIEKFGDFYKQNKWGQTSVTFNGGHTNTEDILRNKFTGATNTPFTSDNYNAQIERFKTMLKNNQIKSGDQLMIYLDSHGAMKYEGQQTHDIATSGISITDYNTLSGSSTVSLDKLKELTALAKQKGVRMAIIDDACHSGNSISLGDENTCVISATGPNHYSYGGGAGTFAYSLADQMKKGRNLEDVFLDARKLTTDSSFPMISTPQNQAITKFEYENISPYLYYYDDTADKLSSYILGSLDGNVACKREDGFKKLNEMLDRIEKINTVKKKVLFTVRDVKEVDLSDLRADLKSYKDAQDQLIKNLKDLHAERLNRSEDIFSDRSGNNGFLKINYKWSELITTDFDKWIRESQDKVNQGQSVIYNRQKISLYQNAKIRKQQILQENPGIETAGTAIKDFDKNVKNTRELAGKIANGEKALYHALYKGQSTQNQSNACKNFVL